MKSKKDYFGHLGYYGVYLDEKNNEISKKMNELVDEYNLKIDSFETYEEQINFSNYISTEIKKLSGEIV